MGERLEQHGFSRENGGVIPVPISQARSRLSERAECASTSLLTFARPRVRLRFKTRGVYQIDLPLLWSLPTYNITGMRLCNPRLGKPS